MGSDAKTHGTGTASASTENYTEILNGAYIQGEPETVGDWNENGSERTHLGVQENCKTHRKGSS